jgi:hypothetical protein
MTSSIAVGGDGAISTDTTSPISTDPTQADLTAAVNAQ